jgi:hypothetical protein
MKKLKNKHGGLLLLISVVLLESCLTLKESPKFGFNEGYYKSRIHHKKEKKVYVVPDGDTIKVYTKKTIKQAMTDTLRPSKIAFPDDRKPDEFEHYVFKSNTHDIDLITTFLKYRPTLGSSPYQFAGIPFNMSAYIGYRSDSYHLVYKETPLHQFKRNVLHYGFSVGVFTGLGSANINVVTPDSTTISNDGMINLSGVAAFLAIERFTYGISLGVDHLLDKNRKHWKYQGKPWIGLSLGFNLH